MRGNSEIIAKMTGLLYPFIIVFGFYIIANGHLTPGGGFQGGAILSAVFITRYLVFPFSDFRIHSLQIIEKVLFICIILVPILYLFTEMNRQVIGFNEAYMVLMNFLIGIKVCCGLTIIFFRFVFYEGGD